MWNLFESVDLPIIKQVTLTLTLTLSLALALTLALTLTLTLSLTLTRPARALLGRRRELPRADASFEGTAAEPAGVVPLFVHLSILRVELSRPRFRVSGD